MVGSAFMQCNAVIITCEGGVGQREIVALNDSEGRNDSITIRVTARVIPMR